MIYNGWTMLLSLELTPKDFMNSLNFYGCVPVVLLFKLIKFLKPKSARRAVVKCNLLEIGLNSFKCKKDILHYNL